MMELDISVLENAINVMETTEKCFADEADNFSKVQLIFLKELKSYKRIGTVEEYREAREKQILMKPKKCNMTTVCPECGTSWNRHYFYCPGCGQKIDWSAEK